MCFKQEIKNYRRVFLSMFQVPRIWMRKYSFFQGFSYVWHSWINTFHIFFYLNGHTLHQSASSAGMEYHHTSVNWASYVREIFCEFVYSTYKDIVFDGDVEIDESLFGRKLKYNRGNPTGTRIWIFENGTTKFK